MQNTENDEVINVFVSHRLCAREGEPSDQHRAFVQCARSDKLSAVSSVERVNGVEVSHDDRGHADLAVVQFRDRCDGSTRFASTSARSRGWRGGASDFGLDCASWLDSETDATASCTSPKGSASFAWRRAARTSRGSMHHNIAGSELHGFGVGAAPLTSGKILPCM